LVQEQETSATEQHLAALEAILFVAGEPVNLPDLRKALDVEAGKLDELLDALNVEYVNAGRGLRVMRHGEQVQLVSAPHVAVYIERYIGTQSGSKLSAAALETLMVVAYRQPVTRSGIEAVRGVDSSGVINTLQGRGLIEEVGRAESIGHPALFGTTVEFLHQFGLNSLNDLPHVEGLSQPKPNESST
jgi:segregation and condensation protein B